MIHGVYTVEPIRADAIQGIVQVMGPNGTTLLVCREDDTTDMGYVSLRNLSSGNVFQVYRSRTLERVIGIESWESMSADTRMDIELDLMTRGL